MTFSYYINVAQRVGKNKSLVIENKCPPPQKTYFKEGIFRDLRT